jgi:chromosome partitioning protein
MKIITIANRKGGTGKSTVSFNLGFTFALHKKKVLFIDLDSQGNLSILCKKDLSSLESFKTVEIKPLNQFIDVLPATKRFGMLENEINQLIDRNFYLRDEILPKINGYDYVLIDTPPALNILNINAFCISDFVYIIVNPDYFSINGLVEMKEILNQVHSINKDIDYRIVLNAFFKGRNFVENVRELLSREDKFAGVEIPHRQHIIDSSAMKKAAIDNDDIYQPFEALANLTKDNGITKPMISNIFNVRN